MCVLSFACTIISRMVMMGLRRVGGNLLLMLIPWYASRKDIYIYVYLQ